MALCLHQAALLHKFLAESVNFMIDLHGLQYEICSGGTLLDSHEFEVITVLALLARRLIKVFLDIGFGFGFGSLDIRTTMAGPVIAII